MQWNRRHTVGVVLVVLGAAFYVYFIHRSVMVKDAEGWHLRFSHLLFHCPVCSGRVEELTFSEESMPIPKWRWQTDDQSTPRVNLWTPVGEFTAYEKERWWRYGHISLFFEDAEDVASVFELSRGWYDARGEDPSSVSMPFGPFIRKQGTPAHWCLVATHNQARWVEPGKIGELEW